jgi:hypothetical protein
MRSRGMEDDEVLRPRLGKWTVVSGVAELITKSKIV